MGQRHCCRSHWFGWKHALLQIWLIQMEACIDSCGHWAVVILKYLLCLSAEFSWLYTQLFAIFSATDNFHLLDCSVTNCDMVIIEANWRRLNLLSDSWLLLTYESGNANTNLKPTQTAAYEQNTAGCCCWCVNHGRTAAASAAILWQYYAQEMYLWVFKKLHKSGQFSRNCPINFEKCEIVWNTISFHIKLLRCDASHRLNQVSCLAPQVISPENSYMRH